ncbi:hypothetical protein V2J09_005271 [Rumex salicifolius]
MEHNICKSKTPGLQDIVFSWSFHDICNDNLYKNQVKEIPGTFDSVEQYMNSFKFPLLEETREALFSEMQNVSKSPYGEISYLGKSRSPKSLYYEMKITGKYKPVGGDVIAFNDVKPETIHDINRAPNGYRVAYVKFVEDHSGKILILSSKSLPEFKDSETETETKIFVVYLGNLTTNVRIWNGLNPDFTSQKLNVIERLLKSDPSLISASLLDESQKAAVTLVTKTSNCTHRNTINLIWGPPGTGKTMTVATFLDLVLRMKVRTLTCAPTNTAVVQVACRVKKLIQKHCLSHGNYGLGDMVLFGNKKRMKIDEHHELADVFLDYRVDLLIKCLSPLLGWRPTLLSLISLVGDPQGEYSAYLEKFLKDSESEENQNPMLFEEFADGKLSVLKARFVLCIKTFCAHLPTNYITLEEAKAMLSALTSIEKLKVVSLSNPDKIQNLIKILMSLTWVSKLPNSINYKMIKDFCLVNASLVICTASSTSTLPFTGKKSVVVIDEAAQLKECESTIPLQLPGLQHAVLIGDQNQLPAMVQSKIAEEANFGRSLFERLTMLGKKSHLLNVQYRMHPSISLFPNREFYNNEILDAQNVKLECYKKQFLQGKMYNSYSFINISGGNEEFDMGHSARNPMEVAAVMELVTRLQKGWLRFDLVKQNII